MKWKKNGRRLRFWILRRERIIHTCNYNDDMNSTNLLLSFDMMLFASSSFYYRRWCCIRIIAAIAFLPPLTHVSYHFFCVGFESRAHLYRYEAGENWKFYMHIEQSAFHEYYHVFFSLDSCFENLWYDFCVTENVPCLNAIEQRTLRNIVNNL